MLFHLVFFITLAVEMLPLILDYILTCKPKASTLLNKMLKELKELQEKQDAIFIMDEFSKHAKLQREINKLNEKIKCQRGTEEAAASFRRYCMTSFLYLAFYVSLVVIVYLHGSSTVVQVHPMFDSEYLMPKFFFNKGVITCWSWVLWCNVGVSSVTKCAKNYFYPQLV